MEDLDQIYRTYASTVYKFLMVQCRNETLAEELTQETFYQAVRSIERFDGSCKISVWLCQIAKHLWYRYLEKHRREMEHNGKGPDVVVHSAEEDALSHDRQMTLMKQIHLLPEPAREVVYLRAFGGLSFQEIGATTGKSETWARVTFYRSKERLKGEVYDEN